MASAHENPFQWLQMIDLLAKQQARGLPRQEQNVQQIWKGIAFRLDEFLLVSPLAQIQRIIACPTVLAKVPGAKPWVRGIANVSGQLLPIIDLPLCLGRKKPIVINNRTRVLVINQAGVSSGVLVDELMGIKHFEVDALNTASDNSRHWYVQFANGTFAEETRTWIVFDMLTLARSRLFLDAAA
jgi:twitching motility protein PilI